ncbi:MAG: DNA polymerase III subunit delta' [Candidatus Omnitrophota bacterium]
MSFKDIRGQEEPISRLKNAIKNNKVASSYIFAGLKGSGRFLLAANFAKALNCASLEDIPCDICQSCKKIDSGNHPDVRIVLSEAKGGEVTIQSIRGIARDIVMKPYEGRHKVFIIKDAHLLNIEAANSFLKTLEEPPAHSVLILIAEEPGDLLPTIVSRCQIIRIDPLRACILADILVAEYGIERQKAASLARMCEGRLGRFKEAGDAMLSNRDRVLEKFSEEEFIETLSRSSRGSLSDELSVLAAWYRDILVFKATKDTGLVINYDRINDIKEQEMLYSRDALLDAFNSVLKAKDEIENNINPKIALSAMFK